MNPSVLPLQDDLNITPESLVMSDGYRLYYRRIGQPPGTAPTLVLLHGWGCHGLFFSHLFERLSRVYDLIIPDLRGHGLSGKPARLPQICDLANDLAELIANLQLREVKLVGWSMGAGVAFQYLQSYGWQQLAGLAIIDMTPRLVNSTDWQLGIRDGYDENSVQATLASIRTDWRAHCQKMPQAMLNARKHSTLATWLVNEMASQDAECMAALWSSLATKDNRSLLPSLNLPTIIIAGDESMLYSVDTAHYMASKLPDAQLAILPGCGHGPPLQQPDACANWLLML